MLIYYLLFMLWFGIYGIYRNHTFSEYNLTEYEFLDTKPRKKIAFLCWLPLFLIMALRAETVGTDTAGYMRDYIMLGHQISHYSLLDFIKNEMGFKMIEMFFSKLGVPWQLFLVIVSLFVTLSIARFIKKYTANIFLGFYLYGTIGFFSMSMTGIRQTLAVAFVLLGFSYFKEKKYITYGILMFLACSIHYTAIVCIPIGFVTMCHYKNKKNLYVISLLPIVIRFLSGYIYPIITRFSLKKYTNSGYFDTLNLQINVLVELVAFAILFACLICLLIKPTVCDRDYQFFILLSIYVSCIEMSHATYMASRLGCYFIFFMTTMLANAIYRIDDKRVRYIGMIFMIILPLAQFAISVPGSSYGIDEYEFFW